MEVSNSRAIARPANRTAGRDIKSQERGAQTARRRPGETACNSGEAGRLSNGGRAEMGWDGSGHSALLASARTSLCHRGSSSSPPSPSQREWEAWETGTPSVGWEPGRGAPSTGAGAHSRSADATRTRQGQGQKLEPGRRHRLRLLGWRRQGSGPWPTQVAAISRFTCETLQ